MNQTHRYNPDDAFSQEFLEAQNEVWAMVHKEIDRLQMVAKNSGADSDKWFSNFRSMEQNYERAQQSATFWWVLTLLFMLSAITQTLVSIFGG